MMILLMARNESVVSASSRRSGYPHHPNLVAKLGGERVAGGCL